jgi:hypothetical protein
VVVRVNPVLILDALASAPAGATPVASAHVDIRRVDGSVVATTSTDAQGHFRVPGLPPGFLTVEVRLDAQAEEPDARIGFTSIAGATLELGAVHAVARDEAAAVALQGAPAEALVLGTMQPLPGGTVIQPRGRSPKDPALARTLSAPAYFFMIDPEPSTGLSHDLVYVFVDAGSGAVERIEGVPERPRINGEAIWSSDLDYFVHPGFDPLTIDVGIDPDAVPAVIEAMPSDEVVQLPSGPAPGGATATSAIQGVSPLPYGGADGIFVILIRAAHGSAARADWLEMFRYFKGQGIPMGNILSVIPERHLGPMDALSEYDLYLSLHNGRIQERLNIGLASTLIVYITGHQNRQEDPVTKEMAPQGDVTWELKDGRQLDVTPSRLRLKTTPACKLRVIVDICFAELFGIKLVEDIETLPEDERPDLLVLCASEKDDTATQIPGWLSFFSAGLLERGGPFTQRIRDHARVSGGDLSNVLDPTGTAISEDLDPFGQDAVAIIRPNLPYRCVGAHEPGESVSFLLEHPEHLGRGAGASQSGQRASTSGAGAFGISGPFFLVGGIRQGSLPVPPGVPPPPPQPPQPLASVVLFNQKGEQVAPSLVLGIDADARVSATVLSALHDPGSSQLRQAGAARTDILVSYGSIALTVTGWNADLNDFGLSQVSPQVTNVTDVWPYGSDPESGGATIAWFGGNTVFCLEYDPSIQYFKTTDSITVSGASGGPVSAFRWQAGGQTLFVTDGQPGELWSHGGTGTLAQATGATKVGDLGNGPRQIRFQGEIGVVSNFDSDTLTIVRRQSNGTVTILGTVAVGDGPISVDLRPNSAGNIEVLSTGFNNHTYTLTTISPATGAVVGTPVTRTVPEGGLNPVHAIFVNEQGTRISISCNGSGEVLIFDLPTS